jgi:hypothetical protein
MRSHVCTKKVGVMTISEVDLHLDEPLGHRWYTMISSKCIKCNLLVRYQEEHAVRVASLVSSLQTLLARLRARDQQQRQQPPPNNASAPVTRPPPLASGNTPSIVQSTAARSEDGVDDDGDDEEVCLQSPI